MNLWERIMWNVNGGYDLIANSMASAPFLSRSTPDIEVQMCSHSAREK